jgi:hypothetical protein
MTTETHESLMPLYIVGGIAAIGGIFYLLNKNIDKATSALASNKTVQALTDPVNVVEKAAYSTGWDFWDWYDSRVTEPMLRLEEKVGLR